MSLFNPFFFAFMFVFCSYCVLVFYIEDSYNRSKLIHSETKHATLLILISLVYLSITAWMVRGLQLAFYFGSFMNLFTITILLKMISFSHTLSSARSLTRKIRDKKGSAEELNELIASMPPKTYEMLQQKNFELFELATFKHLMYFIAAPTLCFQLHYPRTNKIRVSFIVKRTLEFVLTFCGQTFVLL